MLTPTETARHDTPLISAALESARCVGGRSLLELSEESPVLIVFLRHSGCPFCVEALHDIARQRGAIEGAGVRIVLVHMAADSELAPFFESNGVGDVARISDPDQSLYRAFGLRRGGLRQLMGTKVWLRFWPAISRGRRAARAIGDPRQMPGAFLIHRGEVLASFRHESQADRPDYCELTIPLGVER